MSLWGGLLEAIWREELRARFRPRLLSSEATESARRVALRRAHASGGEIPLLPFRSSDALLLVGGRTAVHEVGCESTGALSLFSTIATRTLFEGTVFLLSLL